MLKNWFYRLLLSYLPVFVLIVGFLVLSSVLMLSDMSKRATIKSNEILTRQVLQNIDNVLKALDQAMVREIFAEKGVAEFIRNPSFTAYDAAMRLKGLKEAQDWVDSVYLVREQDGVVVTETRIVSLDTFEDRQYVQQLRESSIAFAWSGVRELYNGTSEKKRIVSLAKVIHQSPAAGFLVVQVREDKIRNLLREMSGSSLHFIRLLDAGQGEIAKIGLEDGQGASLDELSQAKSDYSHYEIRSGVKYISVLDRLSTFTYAIMGAGIASALLGIVWIVFVSRRNYKPVERIVNRLDKIKKHSSGKVRDRQDEFQVIELAIERMAEDSERFERRHEEDLLYKRQILFLELLEGKRQIIAAPYLDASEFGIGADTGPLQVVVAEIDGYAAFADQYGRSDQNLLKYAMEKTANELAELYGLPVMSEWTAHNRFSLLLQLQPPPAVNHPLFGMGTELLKWIGSHLPFTITLSIGCCVDGIQNVSQSYNSAITQLEYKPSLGNNRIIQEKEVVGRPHTDMYRIVQLVRPFTQAYKLGESDWPEKLETFFDELGQGIFTRDDLESLMNYAMYHFHREMTELASESKSLWEQAAMPKMILLLERTETLEELRSEWTILLKDVWQRMHLMREQRNHSLLLKRMKAYIHEHYADPDVSLTSLSDVFGLSPKYLSRLFKEEFGETFVEYILNVRIEQAKRKLTESADSVQEISMQVGYTTSIAFIRVFKKTVGVTPGDYRKEAKAYGFENDL